MCDTAIWRFRHISWSTGIFKSPESLYSPTETLAEWMGEAFVKHCSKSGGRVYETVA